MNKTIKEKFEERLTEFRKNSFNPEFRERLEIQQYQAARINRLYNEIEAITGRQPINLFLFKAGKIMGIVNSIRFNPKYSTQLLELTGLSEAHIEMAGCMGQLPYVTKQGELVLGEDMNFNIVHDYIKEVASILGLIVTEEDLSDINPVRWQKLYDNALDRAKKTIAVLNEINTAIEYEE